jgi:hypothetical protein
MSRMTVKHWHRDEHSLTSPHLTMRLFKDYRKFLTRAQIEAEFNDQGLFIRIPINKFHVHGPHNMQMLEKLHLIG